MDYHDELLTLDHLLNFALPVSLLAVATAFVLIRGNRIGLAIGVPIALIFVVNFTTSILVWDFMFAVHDNFSNIRDRIWWSGIFHSTESTRGG